MNISILTFNMDSNPYNCEERLNSLINIIKKLLPDIILLQECTRQLSEKVFREIGIGLQYKKFFSNEINNRPSEIIFSKIPFTDSSYISFKNSNENRGLSVININGLWICTSQFDYGIFQKRSQIADLEYLLKTNGAKYEDPIIFGGDTRIMEYQKDISCPNGWFDAWYEIGDDKNKYTFDNVTNLLVKPPNLDRPDRIWFKNANKLECVSYDLIGNNCEVIPSSHYGVFVKFIITK